MKNKSVSEFYDKIYEDDPTAFKRGPLPLVTAILSHIQSGSVLDIGAAQGDNSIFLAEQGFAVESWDISPRATDLLRKNASEAGVSLVTRVADIATEEPVDEFDIVICTFTLHHLLEPDAISAIEKIQRHTKTNGFNIITAFTMEGDLFANNPEKGRFYLENRNRMENLYKGWNIIKIFEKSTRVRAVSAVGTPQHNVFIGLLAKK